MVGYVRLSPPTPTFFVLVSDFYDCGFSQKYDDPQMSIYI